MPHVSGLTIRQHERQSIELAVEVAVAEEHQQQVRFSPASGAAGCAIIRGTAVDISSGGMGLVLRQFLPRMCEGEVRIFSPTAVGRGADGAAVYEAIFEHRVKVRRVYMTSHEPTYTAGLSFVDPEPGLEERVREVLAAYGHRGTQGAPEGHWPQEPVDA
jgi:c-di-GMP-binding flagellar brake protein YcgR